MASARVPEAGEGVRAVVAEAAFPGGLPETGERGASSPRPVGIRRRWNRMRPRHRSRLAPRGPSVRSAIRPAPDPSLGPPMAAGGLSGDQGWTTAHAAGEPGAAGTRSGTALGAARAAHLSAREPSSGR